MTMKSFFFVLLVAVGSQSCNSQTPSVKNLNADEFEKAIADNETQLVDVRTPGEYKEKHIQGAVNININDKQFESRMNELDKSKPVYIYCLSGGRSKTAADWASKNGFKHVYHLEYGINEWMADKKPIVNEKEENVSALKQGMSFDDYLAHIKKSDKLVLVDFNAVWCGPCKILKPIVTKVVKKNSDRVVLFDVDVDQNPDVANTMNIRAIPLLLLYKDGKEVWRYMGVTDEAEIEAQVSKFSM